MVRMGVVRMVVRVVVVVMMVGKSVGGFGGKSGDAGGCRRLQVRIVRGIKERVMLEHFVANVLKGFARGRRRRLGRRRRRRGGLLHEIVLFHHFHVLVDCFQIGRVRMLLMLWMVLMLLLLLLLMMSFALDFDGIFAPGRRRR